VLGGPGRHLSGMKTMAHKKIAETERTKRTRRPGQRSSEPFALKTILVPTDFSPSSLKALQYATPLAKKFGASVHLIHANELAVQEPLLATTFKLRGDFDHKQRRRLQEIGASYPTPIIPARCHLRSGWAAEQICREARLLRADLIVIATHGYGGLKHVMLGSTAERVVRHAPCPVLVVREREREFVSARNGAQLRLHQILVPTDFSQHARDALGYAVAFAKGAPARS
jgi:universal stress protein A